MTTAKVHRTPESVAGATVLTVDNVCVALEPSGTVVDEELSLSLREGEIVALVGESASGKTTAATSLLAHQRRGARIVSGAIRIDGENLLAASPERLRRIRGARIAYVPQDASASLNPALRIGTQLRETLEAHDFGAGREDRRNRLVEMMAEVKLPADRSFLRSYPHQLSGGQQQRVAIAMALACRPSVIVFDEPTTALDVTTQAHVLETIRHVTRVHRIAALYVTHDLAVIANIADRVAVMYAGRIVEFAPRADLFEQPVHPYTRRLLAAIPDLSGRRPLHGIDGKAPRPGQRPPGCAFAPRCDLAVERCATDAPPVTQPQSGREVRCWRWQELSGQQSNAPARPVASTVLDTPRGQDACLEVPRLEAFYGERQILHDVSISLKRHHCLALVGESGSGKTTLARCIAGLHPSKYTGEIRLEGKVLAHDVRSRSRDERKAIQYVFQSPYSSLNPRKTIKMILEQPIRQFFDLSARQAESRMIASLEQVSLDSSILSRYPNQLSGGERQRVAIARALAAEPSVLVCDEVTSALDVSVQASIVELLQRLRDELGISMLFVTHNLALVRNIAQEMAVMHHGRIVERGGVDAVLDRPVDDYTRALIADTPTL
ncbi:dipeptide ABC transporter ATP-binding protein [Micromonospora sp. NPDC048830]|uniref:dipeptide ABC transporter ATP-binding protein n=1 Tax=Micromonospora sp. NPDC048830 TaxID=3364257 RepID=UPI003711EF41